MRKTLSILILTALCMLCACSRSSTADSTLSEDTLAAPLSMSVGYTASESDPIHTMLQDLSDKIYTESKGLISVDLYGNGELGSEKDLADQVMAGQLDAAILSSDTILPFCPQISVLRLPFLFADYGEAENVLESDIGDEILSALTENSMIPLCYADGHLWQLSNSLRPVTSPGDLTGMMLHTTADELTLTVYENFSALPAPLDMEELPSALSNHVFNGQVGSLTDFQNMNLSDSQPYLSIMNLQYDTSILVVSEAFWSALPPSYQRMMKQCAKDAAAEHRAYIRTNEETILKGLRDVAIAEPSRKAFQKQSESVYEDYCSQNTWAEDLIEQIEKQRN